METIKFKPIHQDSIPCKCIELKKQIDYYSTKIAPNFDELEDWQINEYVIVHKQNIEALNGHIIHMRANESIFNELLNAYNLTVTIFIRKYIIDSVCWDLIKKYEGTETEKNCNEYAKNLSSEHPIFKIGDVIQFWTGYYNDILVKSKIIGFGKSNGEQETNDNIFIFWDCWWSPIKNDSNRNIKKVN